MSPTASIAPRLTSAEFGATHNESFVPHGVYFFKDGNVTFLIDSMLYCVHRYFFSRDSVYFSTRFAQLGIPDHEALPTIISIGGVEHNDFEALLSILYPTNFGEHELTYEQWKSVLRLSTRWGFASLRKLALKSIKPPTSHDQLVLARTYSVGDWVLPALTSLCSRTLPLSLDEARQMSMEDVILVATVREEIRGGTLRVDVADIPRHMAKAEAESQQAKLEAETRAKSDAEPKAKAEAKDNVKGAEAQKAKSEAEAKAKGEAEAKGDVDLKAKTEAREAKHWAEVRATARVKCEAEAKATTEAESKEKFEACVKAKAEAEAQKKAEAGARENQEAEVKAKAEADAKVVEVKAAEEAKVATAKAELEVNRKAEKRLELEAKSKAAAAKVKAEEERKSLRAKQAEEQIAKQRVADKAARAAAATTASSPMSPVWGSGGGSWFSKITSAAAASAIIPPEELAPLPNPPPKSTSPWNSDPWSKRHVKNASSPGTELSPLRGPGAPLQHSSTTSSNPRGFTPTHFATATSITAAQSSTSAVSSSPTLVAQERKPIDYKQDVGKAEGKQATAAKFADAATHVPDETKSKTVVVTPDKPSTAASKTSDVVGGATPPDAPSEKSAPSSIKAKSTQAQKTEEVVTNPEPIKNPAPASTAAAAPLDAMPDPPVPEKIATPVNDATLTKQHDSTSEPAASASAKSNGGPEVPNAPYADADAKKALTEAPPVTQGNGEKADAAATEPALQPSKNGEVGGDVTKIDNAKPEGLVRPALRLDHVREVRTASTMSSSSTGTPADEALSSSLEKEDDGEASGARFSKSQRKKKTEGKGQEAKD